METNNIKDYESYIGKQVKGFKFDTVYCCGYNKSMDEYVGVVGTIIDCSPDHNIFRVEFEDTFWWYPADLVIKQLNQKEELVEMMEKDEEAGIYVAGDDSEVEGKPKHYSNGIDTFERMEANCTTEECLAFAKGNIDKYNWRTKGQDLEDFDKIIAYAKWAKSILNKGQK